jgi:hypothetical protein
MRINFRGLAIVMCIFAGSAFAAATTNSIGTAAARGEMRVDSYVIAGNATLMNGSVVESGKAGAELRLGKGIAIRMAAGSKATVYADHLVLEQGITQLTGSYRIQALGFAVTPKQPGSRAVISVVNGNAVDVGSVEGEIAVFNARGTLLASVGTGEAFEFAAGQSNESEVTGVISQVSGRFFVTTADGTKYRIVLNDDAKMRETLNALVRKQAVVKGMINGNEIDITSAQSVPGTASPGGGGGTSITPLVIGVAAVGVGLGTALAIGLHNSSASR